MLHLGLLSSRVLRLRQRPATYLGLRVQGAPRTRPRINRAHRGFDRADRKTWYKTTVPLTEPWSCDWENWDNASYFLHPYSGLSPEAIYLTWCIPGHIYPLAFLPGRVMPEPTYVFVADGRYYWAQYGRLKRIEGPFASDDDFLRRLGEDEWMWERGMDMPNVLDEEIAAGARESDARTAIAYTRGKYPGT